MRIISKFHDYYDNIVQYGQDHTRVFIRNNEKFELTSKFKFLEPPRQIYSERYSKKTKTKYFCQNITIAFAGVVYHALRLRSYPNNIEVFHPSIQERFFYTYDSFKEFADNEEINLNENSTYYDFLSSSYLNIRTSFTDYFTPTNKYYDFFIENKISIVSCYGVIRNKYEVCINPCLKDYQFFKILDPHTAYQELDMFVSGVLSANENNMVQIEDRYRIEQHGFDKWSFRKQKV